MYCSVSPLRAEAALLELRSALNNHPAFAGFTSRRPQPPAAGPPLPALDGRTLPRRAGALPALRRRLGLGRVQHPEPSGLHVSTRALREYGVPQWCWCILGSEPQCYGYVLHCTVLYCTLLYCTALYCTDCTVLYCLQDSTTQSQPLLRCSPIAATASLTLPFPPPFDPPSLWHAAT